MLYPLFRPLLFKLDPESRAETLLTRKINPAHLDGWLVLAGQVFYIEPQAVGPSKVHDLDPATGEDRVVAAIPDSVADFNFSVSHDRRQIVREAPRALRLEARDRHAVAPPAPLRLQGSASSSACDVPPLPLAGEGWGEGKRVRPRKCVWLTARNARTARRRPISCVSTSRFVRQGI